MSAHELFRSLGVSKRLVDDFLKPTLLVGLFKPPEELSAAVTMELLYFYALAHQTSFDVRWLKRGTVQTTLLKPFADDLEARGVVFRPKTFVTELTLDAASDKVDGVALRDAATGATETLEADAVVLALGAGGTKRVIGASPAVAARAPDLAAAASLNAIDVVAVRIWFDETVATDTPVGVFSKFDELRGAGGTFFMLDQLQEDCLDELWGGEEVQGSVLSCDFYNAGAVATLSDDAIVALLAEKLLPSAYFRRADLPKNGRRGPAAAAARIFRGDGVATTWIISSRPWRAPQVQRVRQRQGRRRARRPLRRRRVVVLSGVFRETAAARDVHLQRLLRGRLGQDGRPGTRRQGPLPGARARVGVRGRERARGARRAGPGAPPREAAPGNPRRRAGVRLRGARERRRPGRAGSGGARELLGTVILRTEYSTELSTSKAAASPRLISTEFSTGDRDK